VRALVLGGIAWNTMLYVDAFPEPRPQTVFARSYHETVGSSGAGKALNLRRLGWEVTLWGLLGADEPGDKARRYLRAAGIDLVDELDPAGTMRHVNLMDSAGERLSIFANPGSIEFEVDVAPIAAIAASSDLVSVTIMDYCRGFLPALRETGRPIWIDIHDYDGSNPYHRDFIAAADYLQMSSVANPEWRSLLEHRVAAGTTAAICTHGSAGASGLTATDGWIDVPATPVPRIVDSNGAGDAFFAGFATNWLSGATLATALEAGARVAAATLQSPDLAPTDA
jgi:sugar/nucleoside kinase (ribokinase family)